ncbi:MAG: TrmH family RNA methyltransferase [Christensenellales bacterium]
MITSKSNELIKEVIKLKEKKYAKEKSKCIIESYKLVKELYYRGLLECILVTEDKFNLVKDFDIKIEIISTSIASFITDAKSTDGVIAICRILENKDIKYNKCLILDRIQDPANMGAIIRSAKAFGYDTIFTINSVFPYTYKTIRASMGHIFGVNIIETNLDNLLTIKQDNNITFITADMNGIDIGKVNKNFNNFAIIIGNEGSGVSKELISISDLTFAIPMSKEVESLNAGVSAGIIMYLLK